VRQAHWALLHQLAGLPGLTAAAAEAAAEQEGLAGLKGPRRSLRHRLLPVLADWEGHSGQKGHRTVVRRLLPLPTLLGQLSMAE
jgi:hypothetical protein